LPCTVFTAHCFEALACQLAALALATNTEIPASQLAA